MSAFADIYIFLFVLPTVFNESLKGWLANEFLPGSQLLLNAPYCSHLTKPKGEKLEK